MSLFYWNPIAIGQLSQLVLGVIITAFLIWQLIKSPSKSLLRRQYVWIAATFFSFSIYILLNLLNFALHPDYASLFLPYIPIAAVMALISLIQFSYHFPFRLPRSRYEVAALILFLCIVIGSEGYFLYQRVFYLTYGFINYRPSILDVSYILSASWAVVNIVRQYFHARHLGKRASETESENDIETNLAGGLTPRQGKAAAITFLLVILFPLGVTLLLARRSFGLGDEVTTEIGVTFFVLATLVGFALMFLNYLPQRSSFLIKISGITLATILGVLGGVSWLIGPIYSAEFSKRPLNLQEKSYRFEPTDDDGYTVARTVYRFDYDLGVRLDEQIPIKLPFMFKIFGFEVDELFPKEDGELTFYGWPRWRDINHRFGPMPNIAPLAVDLNIGKAYEPNAEHGLYMKSSPEKVVFTWWRLPAHFDWSMIYTFQATLYPKGVVEFSYEQLPDVYRHTMFGHHYNPMFSGITPGTQAGGSRRVDFQTDLPFVGSGWEGVIDDYRLDYLAYLDEIYEPIAWFVLFTSALTLILFPLFFRQNLMVPLKSLLDGVTSFEKGELKKELKPVYSDEIGFLTQSFTSMAETQKNLINTLEDRVAERTEEVSRIASKNARLEERNRLSQDLHDAVSQTLFSSVLLTENLPHELKKDPDIVLKRLNELRTLNQNALNEMRFLLLELQPRQLVEKPLGKLIGTLGQTFQDRHQISFSIEVENDGILPEDIQIAFYRVAQESLSNIAKHANASRVHVYFDCLKDTQALLKIEDDGQGFSTDGVPEGHMGLKIMEERLRKIGAALEIDSHPNEGTRISAIWLEEQDD
ncbi:MAG: hypothetical protein CMK09_00960 [Ponticaulis sp.]|nr:hypothetical protein [Ponticaulis sp.]|tara:strand:- start:22554 stop:24989 length:2436 start_codon:yes stop_codon:yes gene_type:complete